MYALSRIACDPLARQQREYRAQLCMCVFDFCTHKNTHRQTYERDTDRKKGNKYIAKQRGKRDRNGLFCHVSASESRVVIFFPRQEDAQMEKTQLRLKHFLSVSHSIIIIPK